MRKNIAFFAALALLLFCGCDNGGCDSSCSGGGGGSGSGRGGSAAEGNSRSPGQGAGGGLENGRGSGSGGGSENGRGNGSGGGSENGRGNGSGGGSENRRSGGSSDVSDGGGDGSVKIPDEGVGDWLDSEVKHPPEPGDRHIWNMLTEDIRRQTVAKSVTFAALGTAGTSLKKSGARTYSGMAYRFSGRCVVVDTAGRRRPYSFSGEMKANKFDVYITEIRFTEPGRN